jgi:hypothetical protein
MGVFNMIPRSLVPILSAVACIWATTAHAGDVSECSIVVEDRAELITFDARRANDTKVKLTGILTGPDGDGPFPAVVILAANRRLTEGDFVELHWMTDEQVELHVHGYDLKLTVVPGKLGVLAFQAFASGRFPVTSHGWGKGGHGHEALIYLEVYPR